MIQISIEDNFKLKLNDDIYNNDDSVLQEGNNSITEQSLLDTLAHKNLEKEKQKEEDEKYRKILEDEYAMYLKEEKEKTFYCKI